MGVAWPKEGDLEPSLALNMATKKMLNKSKASVYGSLCKSWTPFYSQQNQSSQIEISTLIVTKRWQMNVSTNVASKAVSLAWILFFVEVCSRRGVSAAD